MIKQKYFGIYTSDKSSHNEVIEFLVENNILIPITPLNSFEKSNTAEKGGVELVFRFAIKDKSYDFTEKFIDEIFLFIKTFITGLINANLILFNRDFDILTYGYSTKKKRKEALKKFDQIFYELIEKKKIGLGQNSDGYIGSESRFEALKKEQLSFKNKFKLDLGIVLNYLLGNKDFFNRELLDNHPLLLEIFEFENSLKILIELNRRFKFENDDIFTPKPKSKLIFEEYSNQFHSLKQIEFIVNQIESNEKINRAFIISLFDFFSGSLKIKTPSAKLFGEIINEHFGFNFSEIGLNGSEGDKHRQRIETFKKDWEIFTS
ncbi:hypothetical protein [Polaribacter sp. R77954]|uniref:hypothetical protein n=1 Tax=Polaribacter sp. R77954 TaxID=3093870 RepID=UPI0037C6A9CA